MSYNPTSIATKLENLTANIEDVEKACEEVGIEYSTHSGIAYISKITDVQYYDTYQTLINLLEKSVGEASIFCTWENGDTFTFDYFKDGERKIYLDYNAHQMLTFFRKHTNEINPS